MPFEGVLPILAVPCRESGEIDYESVRTQIAALADGGCDGVILFGFGSEFYKLRDGERRELTRVAVDAGADFDLPVYASVTEQTTAAAVDRAGWFADAGVDGLMLLPPHMAGPSEDALLEHMRSVADAVSLPIMVQYAPQNVGVTIAPETFAALSEDVSNVSHFKVECEPPGPYATALLDATDGAVDVLVGSNGKHLIELLDRGGVGVIPTGGLHEFYVEILDRYDAGDREGAIAVHDRLLPMLNHSAGGESFVRFDKEIQARRGFIATDATHMRAPTTDPDDYVVDLWEDRLERALDYLGEL
ncbi:dihydrodipicolinate synthase family protein [Halosimplex amylolyticum]|uniref:dihydrodipicolinate synthase family protein n=1 Tax=Halosimplex amylolyticum TaxID=3396616 RepID=UPI003F55FE96